MRFLLCFLFFLLPLSAHAASCPNVPYTFTPGTVAASGQVNANFQALLNCINGGSTSVISPITYGAACNGSTDDTAALTAMFAAVTTNSTVSFPSTGACVFKTQIVAPIVDNVSLLGTGRNSGLLWSGATSMSGAALTIGSTVGGCSVSGWNIRNLRINSSVGMSSGEAIRLNDMCDSELQTITIGGEFGTGSNTNWWIGLHVIGGNSYHIRGFYIEAQSRGVLAQGDAVVQLTDLIMTHGKIDKSYTAGNNGVGLELAGNVGGFELDQTDILSNNTEVLISQGQVNVANSQIMFGPGVVLDCTAFVSAACGVNPGASSGIGLEISDTGSVNTIVILSGTWIASAANQNVKIDSGVTNLTFNYYGGSILNGNDYSNVNGMFENASTQAGVNISLKGVHFYQCCNASSYALYNAGGAQAIEVSGSTIFASNGKRVSGPVTGNYSDGGSTTLVSSGNTLIQSGSSSNSIVCAGTTSSQVGLWISNGVTVPGKCDGSTGSSGVASMGSSSFPFAGVYSNAYAYGSTAGAGCPANTVNLTTFTVNGGIVTHC